MRDERQHGTPEGRRLVRRAALFTWAFLAATVFVLAAGSAGVAWLLSRSGLPFVRTWIVVMAVVLVPSLVMLVWQRVRERSRRS